jgi:hypothetical protein
MSLKTTTVVVLFSALSLASQAQLASNNPSPGADSSPASIQTPPLQTPPIQTPPIQTPPLFQTIDKHKGNFIRVDPSANWAAYKTIRFAPAVYEPSNPRHQLKSSDAARITGTVNASLDAAFRHTPSSDGAVLEVKPVITDIKRLNPLANVVSFLALQVVVSYGSASLRYELVDPASGKEVGEISSRRNARPWNVYPWNFLQNFETLGHSSVIVKSDARNLRKDLARLAKLSPGQMVATASGAE